MRVFTLRFLNVFFIAFFIIARSNCFSFEAFEDQDGELCPRKNFGIFQYVADLDKIPQILAENECKITETMKKKDSISSENVEGEGKVKDARSGSGEDKREGSKSRKIEEEDHISHANLNLLGGKKVVKKFVTNNAEILNEAQQILEKWEAQEKKEKGTISSENVKGKGKEKDAPSEVGEDREEDTKGKKQKINNNIALAVLTLVSKDGLVITKPVTCENKTLVFESTSMPGGIPGLEHEYFFQEPKKPHDVLDHINKIWAMPTESHGLLPKNGLEGIDEEIGKDVISLHQKITKETEECTQAIAAMSMNIKKKVDEVINGGLELHISSKSDSINTLRDKLLGNSGLPSYDMEKLGESIQSLAKDKTKLKKYEETLQASLADLYKYYWHSEQRLVNYLYSEKSEEFWNELFKVAIDKNFKNKLAGVFLHVHSKFNFCRVCRRTLVHLVRPDSDLREKIKKRLSPSYDFVFKILGSFRIMYAWVPRGKMQSDKIWMPSTALIEGTEEIKKFYGDAYAGAREFMFLKRIKLDKEDEKAEDTKYNQAREKDHEEKRGPQGNPELSRETEQAEGYLGVGNFFLGRDDDNEGY